MPMPMPMHLVLHAFSHSHSLRFRFSVVVVAAAAAGGGGGGGGAYPQSFVRHNVLRAATCNLEVHKGEQGSQCTAHQPEQNCRDKDSNVDGQGLVNLLRCKQTNKQNKINAGGEVMPDALSFSIVARFCCREVKGV